MAERPDYNVRDPNDAGSENSKNEEDYNGDSSKEASDADKKHGLDKIEANAPKQ